MIKVFHFVDALVAGGKERRLVELLKGLHPVEDLGLELGLMSRDVHYTAVQNLGIPIRYLIRRSKKDPKILLDLYRLCRTSRPDVIQTWDSMTSLYALPVAKCLKIKFINGMITDAPPDFDWKHKNWLRAKLSFPFSDAVLANSEAGLKAYRAPAEKSRCIPNGFDLTRLKNLRPEEEVRAELGIQTRHVVGMVAAFEERKDYPTYLEAAELILAENRDVTFLACGDGPDLKACRDRVKPEYRDFIRFLGRRDDIESIENSFDVGVLLTHPRIHGEGISNALMECMALGKPVVASRGGGTEELVVDKDTGWIVEPESAVDAAEKLLWLLRNHEAAGDMGRRGKKRIEDHFSLDRMVSAHVELYRTLVP